MKIFEILKNFLIILFTHFVIARNFLFSSKLCQNCSTTLINLFFSSTKIFISDSDTTDLVDGETHTIISNRVIMAIMTQENFSSDTVGSATADIKWDIVTAPEG